MPEDKLKYTVEVAGAEKSASQLKKVDEAKQSVAKRTATQTAAVTDATKAQDGLNASEGDYIALLTVSSPLLGRVVDATVKGVKILSSLAKQEISVTSLAKKMSGAVGAAGNAIKLLGASGVAVAGLALLWKAISSVREEARLAAEAVKALIDRQTELAQQSAAAARAISAERDATSKRRKPFTFAQEEAVRLTREAAPADIREKLGPILGALGGAKGFGPAPGEFLGTELEALARLGFQPEAEAPQRFNVAKARALLERRQESRAIIEERRRIQRATQTRRAAAQALGPGAEGRGDLAAIVSPIAEQLGIDPQRLQELVVGEVQEGGLRRKFLGELPGQRIQQKPLSFTAGFRGLETTNVTEIAAMDQVMRRLLDVMELIEQQGRINVGYQVIMGADAAAAKARETNGQSSASVSGIEGNN